MEQRKPTQLQLRTPRLTLGEGSILAGTLLSTLPHLEEKWTLLPFAALVYSGAYALRRHPEIQAWAKEKARELLRGGAHPSLARAVRSLAVYPKPVALAQLPEPEQPRALLAETHKQFAGAHKPSERLTPALGAPTRRPERPTYEALQRLTLPPARGEDEDWLDKFTDGGDPAEPELSMRELIEFLNDEETFEDCPHIFIAGPSRAGKTVLAQFIAATRSGKVVIFDRKRPQGWKGPKWSGLPYVSLDDDGSYRPMLAAAKAIRQEIERRYKSQERATSPFPQLTVIIDEWKETYRECAQLAVFVNYVVSIGAEARVRLILLSTSDRAGVNGFGGQADSMDSLTDIRLGQFALNIREDVANLGEKRYHWAVVRYLGKWTTFDNSRTVELLERVGGLKPSKVFPGVRYNVQTDGRVETPLVTEHPAVDRQPLRAKAAQTMAAVPYQTGTYDQGLLAGLMANWAPESRESVKSFGAETRPVSLHSGNSVSRHPDNLSDTFPIVRTSLLRAAEIWRNASSEERVETGKALQLMAAGLGKQEAIAQAFGHRSGRGYLRGKQLVDAARLLKSVRR